MAPAMVLIGLRVGLAAAPVHAIFVGTVVSFGPHDDDACAFGQGLDLSHREGRMARLRCHRGVPDPSRALRRASKRSETSGGFAELAADVIRARGFCGMRFGHVRAWVTTDSLRSLPQSRQR